MTEERSPASMEEQTCALVSDSATPPLLSSQESAVSDALGEEHIAGFAPPTLQQQAAINELQDVNDEKIFAWLALVRSLEHGFRYREAAGSLSCQQVNALSTLRDCSNSNIVIWLQCVALSSNVNPHSVSRSTSKSSTSPLSKRNRRPSARSTPRSSASSLAPSTYNTATSYSTPRSSAGYASSLPDLPEAASESESLGHTHWCPECGKYINSCDGWKRHMKEHETFYPCMPSGPVEDTGDGRRCAFCGAPQPDRNHLAEHHVSLCFSSSKSPTRKSRKSLMVNHLAQHGIYEEAASDLADKWKCERKKQAFSCGFCVRTFSTITDQLNHIDNEHYKHGQERSSWDLSTVIKGLLHQPKVRKFWERLLASDPPLLETHFRWDSPAAESLQRELEVGDKSGADLALTAFGNSSYGNSFSSQQTSNAITVPVLQHLSHDLPSTATQHQSFTGNPDTAASTYASGLNPRSPNTALVSRYQPGMPSRSDMTASYTNLGQTLSNLSENYPAFPGDTFHSCSTEVGTSTEALIGFEDGDSGTKSWTPLNLLPAQTITSRQENLFDQHAHLQGRLSDSGDLLFAQLSYPNYGNQRDLVNAQASGISSSASLATFGHYPVGSTSGPPPAGHVSENRNTSPKSWEKPLPALPISDENQDEAATDHRPRSPMDVDIG